ncbi:MAG: hypothetical protein AMXMBFR84_17970 [Candidatus Hydrogenedentota bacterium]
MRYALISDIHANLDALNAVLARIETIGVDQIVCLGDAVGYNANPDECINILRERNIPTICGNHDAVACGLEEPYGFNPVAFSAVMWTREHISPDNLKWLHDLPVNLTFDHFLAAHGSPTDRDCYMFTWEDILPHMTYLEERNLQVCFFGHTHSPGIFSSDGTYTVDDDSRFALGDGKLFFINPGSVGQPRDGDSRASFGLFDSESKVFELVRQEYDIDQAAQRIVDAELPPFLAERLYLGR